MFGVMKENLKSISVLETIISPEWEYRYFSYNSKWGENEEMASMRDGCGTEWFLWLKNNLAALKVINPEYGVLNDIESIKNIFPKEYIPFISEPAFSIDESTSLWYFDKNKWVKFDVNNEETEKLVHVFSWGASDYKKWAEDYYEKQLPLNAIESIFAGNLTKHEISLLNEDVTYKDIEGDINEIGYYS